MANSYSSSSDNEMNSNQNEIIRSNLDKLLEIQQIEYEQRLIREEINRVDAEKQRLQDLLNLLQSTKSIGRKKKTKSRYHQVKNIDLNFECDSSS